MLPLNPKRFSQPEGVIRLLELVAGKQGRLWLAVTYRTSEKVRQLLSKGHDPLYVHEEPGLSLFRQAALRGDVDILRALAEAGAWQAELKENGGRRALFAAIVYGNKAAVHWLVREGADVEACDELGRNALMKAIDVDKSAIASFLVRRTATLEARDSLGNTALHLAASRGKLGVVRALLEAGAERGTKNAAGKAPADLAAREEIRQLLTQP